MDTLDTVIRGRRSVGDVTNAPVDRDTLTRLVEAALWAPNHKLTNPWRFVVVEGEARDALADAHAVARLRISPGMTAEAMAAQRALTGRAPVIVVAICRATSDDPVVRREDRDTVAAGVQNMLLAAHDEGLGAIWRTGAFVDEPEVRDYLGCGDGDEIVGFIYLGHPAGPPPAPPARPGVDEVTEWRSEGAR